MSQKEADLSEGAEMAVEEGEAQRHKNQHCRMYERELPEIDEVVVVEIARLAEVGVYVRLLEYDGVEGLIQKNQLTVKRLRAAVSTVARVGKHDVALVLSVDKERGYIDLSKARVHPDDRKECEERWVKSKLVHSILQNISEKVGIPLIELYERFGWKMYKQYPHALDGFQEAYANPEKFYETFDIPEEAKAELLAILERKLAAKAVKLRADINLTCLSHEGVEAIKAALRKGEEMSSEEFPLEIHLVSPPRFSITCTTLDRDAGVKRIEEIFAAIDNEITSRGGSMNVAKQPFIVKDT